MDEWIGVVVALAVGLPLLVGALWFDVRRRRRADEELASVPLRNDPTVDALSPRYISQGEVDAMARPGVGVRASTAPPGGVRLDFGHLDRDFATAGDVAEWRNAAVLMVGDDILTMRELVVPLAGASADHPLIVAAAAFHPDVVASLRANRRAVQLPVVAVMANPAELLRLQEVVGGSVLSSADLKAGWVPADALGLAAHWRSDLGSASVTGEGARKG